LKPGRQIWMLCNLCELGIVQQGRSGNRKPGRIMVWIMVRIMMIIGRAQSAKDKP
jgi:hypothetical protein